MIEPTRIKLSGQKGQGKYTIVDGDYDGEYFSQYRWYIDHNGYAKTKLPGHKKTTYLHHLVLTNPPAPGMIRDHINRDRLDNRSANLRWVTWKQSAQNRGYHFNTPQYRATQSGYRGVTQVRWTYKGKTVWYQRWAAHIQGQHLGTYDTPEEASDAYRQEVAKRYTHAPWQSQS